MGAMVVRNALYFSVAGEQVNFEIATRLNGE